MDSGNGGWTKEEIKAFKEAVDKLDCSSSDWFEKLLAKFPRKRPEQIMDRYMGFIPNSEESPISSQKVPQEVNVASKMENMLEQDYISLESTSVQQRARHDDEETNDRGKKRKLVQLQETSRPGKGKAWTEEEHRLYLTGLNIYGKGNWKDIAKNYVQSRTSGQIASHAQKYFKRQLDRRPKRRKSIMDITLP